MDPPLRTRNAAFRASAKTPGWMCRTWSSLSLIGDSRAHLRNQKLARLIKIPLCMYGRWFDICRHRPGLLEFAPCDAWTVKVFTTFYSQVWHYGNVSLHVERLLSGVNPNPADNDTEGRSARAASLFSIGPMTAALSETTDQGIVSDVSIEILILH